MGEFRSGPRPFSKPEKIWASKGFTPSRRGHLSTKRPVPFTKHRKMDILSVHFVHLIIQRRTSYVYISRFIPTPLFFPLGAFWIIVQTQAAASPCSTELLLFELFQ